MSDSGSIGELFVDLGVKGSDKTLGALDGMKSGLKDTASMGLEAKVAIVGAVYAMERLFASSGKIGTGLTNFNSLLGVSAQTLQQYEWAAQQAGVSNQEVEGTFKALQSTLTNTLLGKGAPEGLARVSMLTGGMTTADLKRYAEEPQLLIQKLQEYAQKEQNAGLRNTVLKSFGVGDGMAAALRRGAFSQDMLSKAPKYSDNEINSLDKANIAWSNLGTKIEMAFGRFNAKHGGDIVKDITLITEKVITLAEAFVKLAEKLELMKWFGKAIEGWSMIFTEVTSLIDGTSDPDLIPGKKKDSSILGAMGPGVDTPENRKMMDQTLNFIGELPSVFEHAYGKMLQGDRTIDNKIRGAAGFKPEQSEKLIVPPSPTLPTGPGAYAPPAPITPPAGAGGTPQNIKIDQTLNFQHDGKDSQQTASSVKKAVRDTYRQMYPQSQGS